MVDQIRGSRGVVAYQGLVICPLVSNPGICLLNDEGAIVSQRPAGIDSQSGNLATVKQNLLAFAYQPQTLLSGIPVCLIHNAPFYNSQPSINKFSPLIVIVSHFCLFNLLTALWDLTRFDPAADGYWPWDIRPDFSYLLHPTGFAHH